MIESAARLFLLCLLFFQTSAYGHLFIENNSSYSSEIEKILLNSPYSRYLALRNLLANWNLEEDLMKSPQSHGFYVSPKYFILNQMKTLYETDPKSQTFKEFFAEEELKLLHQEEFNLNESKEKALYQELPTKAGFHIFENLLFKALFQKECRKALLLSDEMKTFSMGSSALSPEIKMDLEQRIAACTYNHPFARHGDSITKQFPQTSLCSSLDHNPFPVLQKQWITLTTTPLSIFSSIYTLGKDDENNLYLFELKKVEKEWELIRKKKLAQKKGEEWINFNNGDCPHKFVLLPPNNEILFVTESLKGILNPWSGSVIHITDLSVLPDDILIMRTYFPTIEEILFSRDSNTKLQRSALDGLIQVYRTVNNESFKLKILNRLASFYDSDFSQKTKYKVLEAFVLLGVPSLPFLERFLREYPEQHKELFLAIKNIYYAVESVPPIFGRMIQSPNPDIRIKISEIIGDTHSHRVKGLQPEAISLLIDRLENDSELPVRIQALKSLKGLRFPEKIVPILLKFLKNSALPLSLHLEAIETLGSKYDKRALPLLVEYLNHPDDAIRKKSAYVLLSSPRAVRGSCFPNLIIATIQNALDIERDDDTVKNGSLRQDMLLALEALRKTVTPGSALEESYRDLLPKILEQMDKEIGKLAISIIDSHFSRTTILTLLNLYSALQKKELKEYLKIHLLHLKLKNLIPNDYIQKFNELNLV